MKAISIHDDIVPIGEFKTGISKWFKNIQNTGHPLIITQNGKPAGVLLSPKEFDHLVYRRAFLDSVSRGIADAESGITLRTKEIREALRNRRSEG
jgi:antitoxin YefM